jgi:preprotein translocase subunit SecG
MIETLVLFGHLVVAGLIIGLVLLQRGKGAEAGTGFGAGASGTVFGARGSASFFSRATAILVALFFATSLALTYFATRSSGPDTLIGDSLVTAPGAAAQAPPGETPEQSPPLQEAPPITGGNSAPAGAGAPDAGTPPDSGSTGSQ